MADQLPVLASGGAVAVPGAAGAVVDHVGDVTDGRGGRDDSARSGVTPSAALLQRLEQRMRLTPEQRSELRAIAVEHKQEFEERIVERWTAERDAEDTQDHEAVASAMRVRWGDIYDSNIQKIIASLESEPPAVQEALLSARVADGTLLANTPAGLEWFLERANGRGAPSPAERDDNERRIAEIEGFLRAPRGSAEYRRYYDDPKVQAEYYDLLNHRST